MLTRNDLSDILYFLGIAANSASSDYTKDEIGVMKSRIKAILAAPDNFPENVLAEVKRLFETESKLASVKYYKNYTNDSLINSKRAVEKLAEERKWNQRIW